MATKTELRNLLPAPLDQLDHRALELRHLAPGESLFHQGDTTGGMFYLTHGEIHLLRTTASGHEVLMQRTRSNHTFAEASLFHDAYHCDAIAQCSSQVIKCSRQSVLDRYEQDANFALAMTRLFAREIQMMRTRLELFSIRSADERVLRALALGMLDGNVKNFAREIGLTHEAVYRSLSSLATTGRIRKTGYGNYAV